MKEFGLDANRLRSSGRLAINNYDEIYKELYLKEVLTPNDREETANAMAAKELQRIEIELPPSVPPEVIAYHRFSVAASAHV